MSPVAPSSHRPEALSGLNSVFILEPLGALGPVHLSYVGEELQYILRLGLGATSNMNSTAMPRKQKRGQR